MRSSGEDEDAVTKVTVRLLADYQKWYTEASVVIKQLLPGRLAEFEQLYKGDGRRKKIDAATFTIQDWLRGFQSPRKVGGKIFDDFTIVTMQFVTQLNILKSVGARFDSSLFDIRQLVQADLFDSELGAARELANRGFLRAAGAVSGVVLERHLGHVIDNHGITTRKKDPAINDLNDLLKNMEVLDIPSWRQIQRLGDIRNLCVHKKERDPTNDEVEELINGVEKYTKTLF